MTRSNDGWRALERWCAWNCLAATSSSPAAWKLGGTHIGQATI